MRANNEASPVPKKNNEASPNNINAATAIWLNWHAICCGYLTNFACEVDH